ncbi:hypothetical protein WJX84_002867 [Apatococcus fuscideae]|uniref:K Homology domain-containing protein n=1 Tax=Apatococcus fuscideae TaxID=2026836 RepID=A0AAW1SYZ2_9CHLO
MVETHLERKLRQLGLNADAASVVKKLHFKLYFPRPPYTNLQYRAARAKDGFNFVGLVLGHQGRTIQQIQQTTGARVEIHSKQGNLNGDHPIATDPTLHAKIIASNEDSLEEATRFVARLLEPVNAEHEEFEVTPGGSAILIAIPKQHAESKRQAKQQRKASLRAEQELQRAFNHRRSHSIDSGNSLISETPSQARQAPTRTDGPGPHDPIVLPARTASKAWSDHCSPAWPITEPYSEAFHSSIQAAAVDAQELHQDGRSQEATKDYSVQAPADQPGTLQQTTCTS